MRTRQHKTTEMLEQKKTNSKTPVSLPISNPKPDLHNIYAHTKFEESPLIFTQVITRERKQDGRTNYNTPPLSCRGQITL